MGARAASARPDERAAVGRLADETLLALASERASVRRDDEVGAHSHEGRVRSAGFFERERGGALFVDWEPPRRRLLAALDGVDVLAGGGVAAVRNADEWHGHGAPVIAHDVHVVMARDSRIRVSGRHGAGKTSLLRALLAASTVPAERGRVEQVAAALGLDPARPLASPSRSPGEVRKLAIAIGLARRAWLLVLDEPTNHLDLPTDDRAAGAGVGGVSRRAAGGGHSRRRVRRAAHQRAQGRRELTPGSGVTLREVRAAPRRADGRGSACSSLDMSDADPLSDLDLDFVRAQFPALASGYVYLDNAGGSQTLRGVADRVGDYLLTSNVQHGASYEISQRAMARVAEAVAAMAVYVGAASAEEIVVGPSTTQLLHNLVLSLLASGQLAAGDEVVVSEAEHEANAGPWKRLAARGVTVRSWPIDRQSWRLEASGLLPLLTARTKLVAFTHVSNLLGAIHDVAALTRLVHEHGARVCVDGVAYAPHRAIDVRAWGVDYYVFSAYKVYAPHLGVLYARRDHLDALAGINHEFITSGAYKLQPGNLNFELTYSLLGLTEYIEQLGGRDRAFAQIAAHEERLAARFLEHVAGWRGVRLLGEARADQQLRVPTFSLALDGKSPEAVVRAVDPQGIGIRHGDFYSKALARALVPVGGAGGAGGEPSVMRVSMVHYNTLDEVDRAAAAIAAALR